MSDHYLLVRLVAPSRLRPSSRPLPVFGVSSSPARLPPSFRSLVLSVVRRSPRPLSALGSVRLAVLSIRVRLGAPSSVCAVRPLVFPRVRSPVRLVRLFFRFPLSRPLACPSPVPLSSARALARSLAAVGSIFVVVFFYFFSS